MDNFAVGFQEGAHYTDEVRNAVLYGYEYRKIAEDFEEQSIHYSLGDSPEILLWMANMIIGGVAWDAFKLAVKGLYHQVNNKSISLSGSIKALFNEEKQLKEFYDDIKEFNEHRMSLTKEQFKYIREEIVADYVGEVSSKIYERDHRMPTVEELIIINREASKYADQLMKPSC